MLVRFRLEGFKYLPHEAGHLLNAAEDGGASADHVLHAAGETAARVSRYFPELHDKRAPRGEPSLLKLARNRFSLGVLRGALFHEHKFA